MVTVGTIVKSMAGKDQGGFYAVVRLSGQRVYIADGRKRKIASPKAKNPRHLQSTCRRVEVTPELTDKQLKKALTMLDK